MIRKNSGFTLIEVVVVLAVVAILAAILTPSIVKSINDSKIARADNEAQVIGAAMATFYKDLGKWPTKDDIPSTADVMFLLNGEGDPMLITGTGVVTNWSSLGPWTATADIYNNHLSRNTPGGATTPANQYAALGKFRWNGPYLTTVEADPWGTEYSCNVRSLWDIPIWTTFAVYILSAGENRYAETGIQQTFDTAVEPFAGGDDIGFRIK